MLRFATFAALAMVAGATLGRTSSGEKWSADERTAIASLTLDKLEALPADPSNRVADDTVAARFGRQLFFDAKLSSNGQVSCATCHLPERDFQDNTPLARGVGITGRRTMPITGTAHSPWLFWDGRTDSQWAQALGPLESGVEHGGDRTQYARYIAASSYRKDYERLFGRIPDLSHLPPHAGPNGDSVTRAAWSALPIARREDITRVYANMGKAIAAFERRITFSPTRFDRYVAVELAGRAHTSADSLSTDEEAGLRLFVGKANCINCHNGARLTDDHFHNTGVPASSLVAGADSGRTTGVHQAVAGEFNCLSRYSDAKPEDCSELRFAVTDGDELLRAFKTPSLRNVAERAPYMHAGQLSTLGAVIEHYDRAPRAPFGKSELKRLKLSASERRQIEAFLGTLSTPPRFEFASLGPIESHLGRMRGEVIDVVSVGDDQRWIVRLESASGASIDDARLQVRAFMPDSDHTLTSVPAVSSLGSGRYEIRGLRFEPSGWWNVALSIDDRVRGDSLAFNLITRKPRP